MKEREKTYIGMRTCRIVATDNRSHERDMMQMCDKNTTSF